MLIDEVTGRREMAVEVGVARRLFTREEYHRMAEVGILTERDRVELIRGEIVTKVTQGRRHRAFIDNLNQLLVVRLAGRAIVGVQGPLALTDDTEPEPDLAILRRRTIPYKEQEAWANDALLLVEVSESSLAYDRSTKLALYAEAGVPEYWIVDCRAEAVEVHRTPQGGGYRDVTRLTGPQATLSPHAFPDVVLTLAELFA
jgi:Uma2 family endonuclease